MVAVNPPGPTGFGPTAGPVDQNLIPFDNSVDGFPVVYPTLTPDGTGNITGANINPTQLTGNGMPVINALLTEMQVLTHLINENRGSQALDLRALRADFAFNMMPSTGQA